MKKATAERARKIVGSTTMRIDAHYKEMLAQGLPVIGFGAGETDDDTPEHIKAAGIAAIQGNFTRYTPAAGTEELRKAICARLASDIGVTYNAPQIVVSSGAKHSIYLALACLLDAGDEVILPAPYWVSYYEQIVMQGGAPVTVDCDEDNGFALDPSAVAAAVTDKTKAIILNNPCNPTGAVIPRETLSAIVELCVRKGIYIISDEIYYKLVYDGMEHVSIPALGDDVKELTVLINGVSKSYAMTGWRLGYAAANPELAKLMANYQSHSTSAPSTISQKAALAALNAGQDGVEAMRKALEARRALFLDLAGRIPGIRCVKPYGAFYIMMNIADQIGKTLYGCTIENADDFAELLLDKGMVCVVPCSGFGAPHHLRWNYAVGEGAITEAMARLKDFLANG